MALFSGLSERINHIFSKLSNRGALTELEIKQAMREVRVALLEADVNVSVAKQFIADVSEKAVGEQVLKSLTPAQQVIKIVNEQLTELMGPVQSKLKVASRLPTVIMMCGLQGAGKTTMCGKLAAHSGFSRALETAHHDDGRKPARNLELALHRSHKLGKLLVDDFYHLLRRSQTFKHLLSYGFFAHVGNKLLRNGHVYVGFQQSDAHLAHGLLYFQFRQRSAVGQLGKNMIYSLTESRKQCHSFSPRRLRAFPQAPPRHLFPDTMFSAFCKFRGFLRFFLQSPI